MKPSPLLGVASGSASGKSAVIREVARIFGEGVEEV